MWNDMCSFLDGWTNYAASEEHKDIEKAWFQHKVSMPKRHRFNNQMRDRLSMLLNGLSVAVSILLTLWILWLLITFFLDGKGI